MARRTRTAATTEPAPQTTRQGVELYRVRDNTTGHHYTIGAAAYDPEAHTILDRPAFDRMGQPLPPKFSTTPAVEHDEDTSTDGAEDDADTRDEDTSTDGADDAAQ